jgi:hypothetical protein
LFKNFVLLLDKVWYWNYAVLRSFLHSKEIKNGFAMTGIYFTWFQTFGWKTENRSLSFDNSLQIVLKFILIKLMKRTTNFRTMSILRITFFWNSFSFFKFLRIDDFFLSKSHLKERQMNFDRTFFVKITYPRNFSFNFVT